MFNFLDIFGKKSLGLDVSDRSLELVEVRKVGSSLTITSFNRALLPVGLVARGRVKDKVKLVDALKELFQTAKPKSLNPDQVAVSLPESQTYLHAFFVSKTGRGEHTLLESVREEIRRNFPIPIDDLVWAYEVQAENEERYQIIAAGGSREVNQEWQEVFLAAGIKVKTFDLETLATYRGIFPRGVQELTAVIDLGAVTTTLSLFDRAGFFYAYSIREGGEGLTSEIAKTFELPLSVAEDRKIRFGLLSDDKNLALLLTKALRPTLDEIGKLERYLRTKFNKQLSEIVLVGGGSYLKGIVDYFGHNLKVPVRQGRIASSFNTSPQIAKQFGESDGLYLEATGLALKSLLGLSTGKLALPVHF